jgi:hypothetical protein|tara:strand:+ start:647 stop:853 length:207 start_codon:yes stop_codon:yes gene_type:complete
MEDLYKVLDIHSMIRDGIVETCTGDEGKVYYRYEENLMSLENFFINYLWGVKQFKSKVIGNVLLFWEV